MLKRPFKILSETICNALNGKRVKLEKSNFYSYKKCVEKLQKRICVF